MKNSIKFYRLKRGLTQEQLAYICGCTRETIFRAERNKNNINIKLYLKILYVLNHVGGVIYELDEEEYKLLLKRMGEYDIL